MERHERQNSLFIFLVLMCLSNATDLQFFCCFRIYVLVSFPFMKLVLHYDQC